MSLELHNSIWLPRVGQVDSRAWRVNLAVKEYDERLSLGRNEETGDWCIYIKMPADHDPPYFPVLGFGPTQPTDPQAVVERLQRADLQRHGSRLYSELMQAHERRKRESRAVSLEQAGIAAEALEYLAHRSGRTPYKKNPGVRSRRGYGEWW